MSLVVLHQIFVNHFVVHNLGQSTYGNNGNVGNSSNNTEIVCQCEQQAVLLTVRKDGPNKGKLQLFNCKTNISVVL